MPLIHLLTFDLFDIELPPELDLYELYYDQTYTQPVTGIGQSAVGNLVIFGAPDTENTLARFKPEFEGTDLVNWDDFPINHIGMIATQSTDPGIIHASQEDGTTAIWPLSRFSDYQRYQKIYSYNRIVV